MDDRVVELNESSAEETTAGVRAIRAASAHVEHLLARALEAHDLTTAQFSVLEIMDGMTDDAIPCSELGRRLHGPGPDVTRLLDRLESGGLVARDRDQKDRRVVHTRITDLGRSVLEKARPAVRMAEAQALADLPVESRRMLTSLLQDVQRRCPGA